MRPQDIEKLLGGYATDTLSEQERQALFQAALGNQALFDALADEQALKELLADPVCRQQLLASLGEPRVSKFGRWGAWLRRPSVLALAGAAAAGIVVIGVVVERNPVVKEARTLAVVTGPAAQPEPAAAQPEPAPGAPAMKDTVRGAREMAREKARYASQPAKKEADERKELLARNEAPAAPAPVPMAAPAPPAPPAAGTPAPQSQSQAVAEERMAVGKVTDQLHGPAASMQQAQQAQQARQAPLVSALRGQSAAGNAPRAANARDLYYLAGPTAASGFVPTAPGGARKKSARTFGGAAGGTAAAMRVPGVRYSLLKRAADGSYAEIEPDTVLHPGDTVRLRLEANQDGNLAVMQRDRAGNWVLLEGVQVREGEPIEAPGGAGGITRSEAGERRLAVTWSRAIEFDASRAKALAPTANLVQKADLATYVVNTGRAADADVRFEIVLTWK